ncbi:MAG: YceI family protein [Chromatiales bacterium]|jgi:polyisoprenoid-binding protein YceI|nr:YceI family protein [Chromatiales bacterium]
MRLAARTGVLLLAVVLAACAARREGAAPPSPAPAVAGAGALAIDPQATELRVLVHRAGALAALGHNHVITSTSLDGRIDALPGGEYRFDLALPVGSFVVDPPGPRAEEGPDFAATVADDARDGTRTNLLGERVLDAARFPVIRLRGETLTAADGARSVALAVTVRDTTREFRVPVTIVPGERPLVRGELPLTHADLGLTPFSVMGGMLAVRDDLLVRFRVGVRPREG